MPFGRRSFTNFLPRLQSSITRRFETKDQRFRLAVSSGFVISAVGVLVLGAGFRLGLAESIWGSMEIPGLVSSPVYRAASEPSAQYRTSKRKHARRDAENESERRNSRHKHLASSDGDQPTSLARKSMCVRQCDGFAFPVGNYYGEGDRAAHEATCQSECPGAQTSLYVVPAGSDSLAEATQVSTGKTYSQMRDAFRYTSYVDEACSCHPAGGSRIKSLLRDFTLRRGDTVMTSKGLQVFHGGAGFPFKRRDFVALKQSRDVRLTARPSLAAIERASLISSTAVASRPVPATSKTAAAKPGTIKATPAMTSDAGRNRTKGLQHQAQN